MAQAGREDAAERGFGNVTFDHAFVVASWDEADGWFFEGLDRCDDITVLAWCDLEPYGG